MLGYKAHSRSSGRAASHALADQKFNFTDYTFHTIVDSTEKRALALIEKTRRARGGRQDHW